MHKASQAVTERSREQGVLLQAARWRRAGLESGPRSEAPPPRPSRIPHEPRGLGQIKPIAFRHFTSTQKRENIYPFPKILVKRTSDYRYNVLSFARGLSSGPPNFRFSPGPQFSACVCLTDSAVRRLCGHRTRTGNDREIKFGEGRKANHCACGRC